MGEYDSAAALTWAASFKQPGDLNGIARELQQQFGPEGARQAIRRSTLTEERKQAMLKTIR